MHVLVDGYIEVGDRVRAAGQRSDRRPAWLRLAPIQPPPGEPELVFTSVGPRRSEDCLGGGHVEAGAANPAARSDGMFRVWVWRGGTPYEIDEPPPHFEDA